MKINAYDLSCGGTYKRTIKENHLFIEYSEIYIKNMNVIMLESLEESKVHQALIDYHGIVMIL